MSKYAVRLTLFTPRGKFVSMGEEKFRFETRELAQAAKAVFEYIFAGQTNPDTNSNGSRLTSLIMTLEDGSGDIAIGKEMLQESILVTKIVEL